MIEDGFKIIGESFRGAIWGIIALVIIFVGTWWLLKNKIIK
jgi:hypothetical protein